MALLENVLLLLLGFAVLLKASEYSVKALVRVAAHFRITEFLVSFFVVGFASIVPELFIGVRSALHGDSALGMGVIIGSNVIDLTLILGIVALVGRRVPIKSKFARKNYGFLAMATLPFLMVLDGVISSFDGAVLVLGYSVYAFSLMRASFSHTTLLSMPSQEKLSVLRQAALAVAAIAALMVSAELIVSNALAISDQLSLPLIFTGLFIVAAGTCLPELSFSLRALKEKHKELAIGDVIGNVALDSTFSLGVVALVMPITPVFHLAVISTVFMAFAALLSFIFMNEGKELTWREGIGLIALYFVFATVEFLVK
ncbi:MAG TPA: hypothetical protein VJI67_01705 [archaeon]|nr:hypothetical protein [archaeon]HLD81457.1 hypothetical protein [archaeon]